MALQARKKKGIKLEGYKIRKGDMIISQDRVGVVTKTTPRYIYYYLSGQVARVKKESVWHYYDTSSHVTIKFGKKSNRRKQRRMRTLDLHGTKHEKVDEKIRKFLNFVELPCKIVTGNSDKMKLIVKSVVNEYGWDCKILDDYNTGTLVVVEH